MKIHLLNNDRIYGDESKPKSYCGLGSSKLNEKTLTKNTEEVTCKTCLKIYEERKTSYEESLEHLRPEIAKEWHPTKNGNLTARDIFATSRISVWWLDEQGHEWKNDVWNRAVRGDGCKECRKIKAAEERQKRKEKYERKKSHNRNTYITEENCFALNNPELLEEWNWEENDKIGLDPYNITNYSREYAHWIGKDCNHKWKTAVFTKLKGCSCPKCNKGGNKDPNNYIDLNPEFKEALEHWDKEENDKAGITYRTYKAFSNKRVYSKCPKCGRKNFVRLISLTKEKSFCKCIEELSEEKHKRLFEEWDYEKNKVDINTLKVNSVYEAHFICSGCNNKWKARIVERIKGHGNCPNCSSSSVSSHVERIYYYYIKKVFGSNVKNNKKFKLKDGKKKKIDISINCFDVPILIEYDGRYYHSNQFDDDVNTNNLIKNNGVGHLIRIREEGLEKTGCDEVFCSTQKESSDIKRVFFEIVDIISKNFSLSKKQIKMINKMKQDDFNFLEIPKSYFYYPLRENSFGELYPELTKFWDVEKNNPLTPYQLTRSNSELDVHFKCPHCDYEFQKKISSIVSVYENKKNNVCPKCNIIEKYAEAIEVFDEELNNISVNHFIENVTKRYKWKLECGHIYEGRYYDFKQLKNCKECREQDIYIKNVYPELKEYFCENFNEQNFENAKLDKGKYFWFNCECGHKYYTNIKKLKNKEYICMGCVDGFNHERFNLLLTEFDKKNNYIDIKQLYSFSTKRHSKALNIGWECSTCGHKWKQKLALRMNSNIAYNRECPHCNSFAGSNEEILKWWHPELNNVSPFEISPHTNKEFWFRCDKCGFKKRKKAVAVSAYGFICDNCERDNYSILEEEWDSEKNKHTSFVEFKKDLSYKKYCKNNSYWICSECGKEYEKTVGTRMQNVRDTFESCPVCRISGNSLKDIYPHLLEFWDYNKNKEEPEEINVNSYKFDSKAYCWIRKDCNLSWKSSVKKLLEDNRIITLSLQK